MLYKGYIKTKGKKAIEAFKDRTKYRTYDEVKNLEGFGGVLADDTILIDIDDAEQSEILMNIVEEYQLDCRVYCTSRGRHFLFKNHSITRNRTHVPLAVGLTADIKLGTRSSYEVIKIDGEERFIEWDIEEGGTYQEVPKWLFPVRTAVDFLDMDAGDGRNQALFNYILTLTSNDFSVDDTRECIRILNRFVLKEPLSDDELEVILRDEAFQKPVFFCDKTFLFDRFATWLKNNENVVSISNQLHIYQDGIYQVGYKAIETAMINQIPNLKKTQRREVLEYMELIADEKAQADARYIAFRNGVLDIVTGQMQPFSSDLVITNQIPWDYNPEAYSELADAHAEFLKVAEYWCGIDGVAWKSEYDEMEDFCKYIIPALEYFGEKNFIEEIREKQKYKMFGYVGRKDYSLNGLLDCYKKLPLNEEKLCCYGMRLFSVSNLADSIGDNRFSSEVDRELLEDAVKLGYKYCNALFELKNHPKDLVYWRMKVLDSLYCNIDLISGDSELLALYKLTNSWIKVNIENDREYNRLETLKSYNYEIISRISSHEIREKLMAKGLYDKAEQKDFSVETGRDYNLEIINLLKEDGYNEKAEGVIITQIEKREIGLHKLIMEAGDIIAPKHMEEYVNRCVVKFILSESKYGYIGSGISDVFERYYEMFNDDTWILLFENIVTRFAESDYGTIASLWGDFTIFSIHYLSRRDKDKIKALFDCLCKTHESLSSANGRVKIKEEKLILDENITSLSDMVNFQLNI